ncbi:ABC transporter substrate-binding protein [Seohaeicola nanhaiensis]|uniref:ABC transporter substrate-binding protein n=1 Tax=Seohaeicola nanhaiensis TaxID=1387282 RepID=A0ABV9KLE5_9RHOB
MKTMTKLMLATALSLAPALALADKANDTATLLFTKELDNANLYYTTAREGTVVGYSAFDTLMYRDPATGDYLPCLATEWEWVDDKTLKLKLREGVTFHNGEAFNADDVVYTINTMLDPAQGIKNKGLVSFIDHAEKIDDFTVVLHLPAPYPAAFEYLAGNTVIYPNEYYAEVGAQGFSMKPVGTGPYMFTEIVPGQSFTLERFDGYFKDSPKSAAKIKTIHVRTIPDVNTQIAELMSGGADFIWQVPTDQAEKLASRSGLNVISETTMRIGYITMDAANRTGNSPFTDPLVRKAVNHAINRDAIAKALLGEKAQVINSACFPTQLGCEQDVTTYDYDPAKAKELLAEAGHADGLTVEFYAYRDRQLAEAMAGMLAEVGITANINMMQYSALSDKISSGEVGMAFMTWGSGSINDVAASTARFFTNSAWDQSHDQEVADWVNTGSTVVDVAERKENYSKALKKIADEAYWVPLWTYPTNYVISADLDFVPTADEVVRFFDMSWK